MKIAILITAYKNEIQLNNLINHLIKDFDIYVHIDKRSKIKVKESNRVVILKEYESYWGSFNTVLAVLLLLKKASEINYDRYVQITGQDLPIKSNNYIIDFFEKHRGVEFIEYFRLPTDRWKNGGIDRIRKYWGKDTSSLHGFQKLKAIFANRGLSIIYRTPLAFLFYRKIQYIFYGGSNYMDLTNHCVKEIIQFINSNPEYLDRFKYTYVPEEIFFQTIILNLNLSTKIDNRILRYVNWTDGPEFPKVLTMSDYPKIISSEFLFARKFDDNIDSAVVKEVYQYLKDSSIN